MDIVIFPSPLYSTPPSDVRNSVLYCIVEYEYGTNSRQVYQELLEKHMIAYSKL